MVHIKSKTASGLVSEACVDDMRRIIKCPVALLRDDNSSQMKKNLQDKSRVLAAHTFE